MCSVSAAFYLDKVSEGLLYRKHTPIIFKYLRTRIANSLHHVHYYCICIVICQLVHYHQKMVYLSLNILAIVLKDSYCKHVK